MIVRGAFRLCVSRATKPFSGMSDSEPRPNLVELLTAIEEFCGNRVELAEVRSTMTRAALVGYLRSAQASRQKNCENFRGGIAAAG
jgi:hypothetical protein